MSTRHPIWGTWQGTDTNKTFVKLFIDLVGKKPLFMPIPNASMPIKSSGRIVPPGWAPLQPKQSVLSLIV